jgi:MerR family transcriptional regulator, light-induced transcriptional regulator
MSIGELAVTTGVAQSTIRSWERRYAFPQPERRPSGHRRYSIVDAELIRRVQLARSNGVALTRAISDVRSASRPESIFAGLRHAYPDLPVNRVKKNTLLALTWALEDECCARAQRPVLIGTFQQERFLAQARRRWEELARTARRTIVFAEMTDGAAPSPGIQVVPLAEESPLRREWNLVCLAADHAAVLSAWEVPASREQRDADRTFEAVWSLQPPVVREAAKTALSLAEVELDNSLAELLSDEAGESPELSRATATLARAMSYLDARP